MSEINERVAAIEATLKAGQEAILRKLEDDANIRDTFRQEMRQMHTKHFETANDHAVVLGSISTQIKSIDGAIEDLNKSRRWILRTSISAVIGAVVSAAVGAIAFFKQGGQH